MLERRSCRSLPSLFGIESLLALALLTEPRISMPFGIRANFLVSASTHFCHYLSKSFSFCIGFVSNLHCQYPLLCDRDCVQCSIYLHHLILITNLRGKYHNNACFTKEKIEAKVFVCSTSKLWVVKLGCKPRPYDPQTCTLNPYDVPWWAKSGTVFCSPGCTTWWDRVISPGHLNFSLA